MSTEYNEAEEFKRYAEKHGYALAVERRNQLQAADRAARFTDAAGKEHVAKAGKFYSLLDGKQI